MKAYCAITILCLSGVLTGAMARAEEADPQALPTAGTAVPAVATPTEATPTPAPAAIPAESEIPELMIYGEEAMVQTATKRLQKLSEVPGSVTIITEQEIREKGALTLREVLLNLSGTELTHEGVFESVRFRGMQTSYNSKILVLVDGRKVNTLDWGSFNDDFGLNLDLIRQIEIVKGPGSSLYGANAFAGVVNIITKNGAQINGLDLKISGGTQSGLADPSQYYVATYGQASGSWDYRVTSGYWREFGLDPINSEPNNLYEGNRFEGTLRWEDRFTLHTGYSRSDIPYQGSGFAPMPKGRDYQDLSYLDAKYAWDLTELSKLTVRLEDTYSLRHQYRQTRFAIDRASIDTAADLPVGATIIIDDRGNITSAADAVGGSYIDLDSALGLLTGRAFQLFYYSGPSNELLTEVQYDLSWPENNYLLAGVSYTHNWSGQDYFTSSEVQDQNLAAYLQDEYHPWKEWVLLAGLRYDLNTAYGSSFSPRGSLIYSPWPGLRLKALYGTAFRAPAFLERYSNVRIGFSELKGNRDLKPERVAQSEVRVEYEVGTWLALTASGFYWETENEIQPYTGIRPLYVFAPDLSQIDPSFPAQPGLYDSPQLTYAQATLTLTNDNARVCKGGEVEVDLRPLPYTKVGFNYCHYNLYLQKLPDTWNVDPGDVDLINGMIGFNYENRFYASLYSHTSHVPMTYPETATRPRGWRDIWVTQVDLSVGVRLRGVDLACTFFNLLEQNLYYLQAEDRYIRGPKITRLTAEYTIPF